MALAAFVVISLLACGWFSYYYIKYDRIIDQRFKGPVFSSSATIYALPRTVKQGERSSAQEIATQLRRAGYSENGGTSAMGTYNLLTNGIEIKPGPESYHSPESATIRIHDGTVASIAGNRANWMRTNWNRRW